MTVTAPTTDAPTTSDPLPLPLPDPIVPELTLPERGAAVRTVPGLGTLRRRAAAAVSTAAAAVAAWAAASPRRRSRTFRDAGPAAQSPLTVFTADELRADLEGSWRRG